MIQQLIRESAKRHHAKWYEVHSQMPDADYATVDAECTRQGFSHRDVVFNTAQELKMPSTIASIVYAMRKSWPEALQIAEEIEGAPFVERHIRLPKHKDNNGDRRISEHFIAGYNDSTRDTAKLNGIRHEICEYESLTEAYRPFVSQATYDSFPQHVKAWYRKLSE